MPLFFLPEGGVAIHTATTASSDHAERTTPVAAIYLVFVAGMIGETIRQIVDDTFGWGTVVVGSLVVVVVSLVTVHLAAMIGDDR